MLGTYVSIARLGDEKYEKYESESPIRFKEPNTTLAHLYPTQRVDRRTASKPRGDDGRHAPRGGRGGLVCIP